MLLLYFSDEKDYEKCVLNIEKITLENEKLTIVFNEKGKTEEHTIDLNEYSEYNLIISKDSLMPKDFGIGK
jgi:hypothetical protein